MTKPQVAQRDAALVPSQRLAVEHGLWRRRHGDGFGDIVADTADMHSYLEVVAFEEAVEGRYPIPTDEVERLIEARACFPRLLATPQTPSGALTAVVGLAATDRGDGRRPRR